MELLLGALSYLGPVLVGIMTFYVMDLFKYAAGFVDGLHPHVQQVVVVVISYGLTQLGQLTDLVLPADLSLFTQDDVSGLLSAVLAMAIHAGNKAKESS